MESILAGALAKYRGWEHERLAAAIDDGPFWKLRDCLEHSEGLAADGTLYQIEINVDWYDRKKRQVMVSAALSAEPQRMLLGFLPIYRSDLCDSFVMAPDGSFLEDENAPDGGCG